MQKAHLMEALYLVNRGTDEAVRGLERLKKVPGFSELLYGSALTKLEHERAQVNLRFFQDTLAGEQKDANRFDHQPAEPTSARRRPVASPIAKQASGRGRPRRTEMKHRLHAVHS